MIRTKIPQRNKAPQFTERTQLFSDEQIEILTIEAFRSTGYLIINKALIKKLGLITSVVLSNYIDKYVFFKKEHPENNGWFFLTHEDQMVQLGLGEHSIIKSKRELQSLGILETKKMGGIPNYEYYYINFPSLALFFTGGTKTIDPPNSGGIDPLTSGGLLEDKENKYNENKEKKENTPPTKQNAIKTQERIINTPQERIKTKPPAQDRNMKYLPLALFLSQIIQTTRNIKHTTTQLKAWTNDIRQLEEDNGVSYHRIEEALFWYEKNIEGQFTPVIQSGSSLKEKFFNLERAMGNETKRIPIKPTTIGYMEKGLTYKKPIGTL